jgi:hypothetical protein
MGGTPESASRGDEACDPLEERCSALKQQIEQQNSSEYVFINTAENLRDTSFQKVRVARAGESFRIVGDAPVRWGLQYKEVEDKQGNRLYLCVNDGNNVSVEKDFEPSAETLFQNPGSGKRSIIFLQDNAPRLSDFIDPETYKNHSFTLQNARGQQMEVAYKNGDWRIVKNGEATDIRALIWRGKNVVSNVQEMRNLPLTPSFQRGGTPSLSKGRVGEGFSDDLPEQQSVLPQEANEYISEEESMTTLFTRPGSGESRSIEVTDNATKLREIIDPKEFQHIAFSLSVNGNPPKRVVSNGSDWMIPNRNGMPSATRALIYKGKITVSNVDINPLVRGNEGVEKQLTPEEQALVNAERLNWKNWSIDSVERKSSLTWCVKRSKTIVFEDGKTKELKNEEYTDALDGKAQEWWESKNGKHEKVIQLSKDDIPLVRKQMEPQEEPLIWGFDDLEYDDDSPMPRPRRREMPAHRNPTGQGW